MISSESVQECLRSGFFRRALDALPTIRRQLQAQEFDALTAELFLAIGDKRKASQIASRLVKSRTADASSMARMHVVLATIAHEQFRYNTATGHIDHALSIAKALSDIGLIGQIHLARLGVVLDSVPFDRLVPIVADAKRAIAHAADPHLLAGIRLLFSKVEAQRSSLMEARRHLLEVGKLLQTFPNSWLQARQQLGLCVVATLRGELVEARANAEAAIEQARMSGHVRTERAGLINLSHVLHAQGQTNEARSCIEQVLQELEDDVDLRVAALDALCNIALSLGGTADALEAIGVIDAVIDRVPHQHRPRWSLLTLAETKARAFLVMGRLHEAVAILEPAVTLAERDAVWATRLRLLLLEVHAAADAWSNVARILATLSADGLSSEARARLCLSLSAGPLDASRRVSALESALRFCAATQRRVLAGGCRAALERLGPHPEQATGLQIVDRLAEIMAVASHPDLLGQEVLHALSLLRCIRGGAVVAIRANANSIRVVEAVGWDHQHARDCTVAESASSSFMDCGTWDGERFELFAEPAESLDATCTWKSMQRLVAAAVAFERYRQEEQQRAALWPTDTVDADGEAIWRSDTVRDVLRDAGRAARSQASILLTGETGSGKEVLAKVIHLSSQRAGKPFVPFNCAATPRELLESQLFGYRKGAFTGADTAFAGVIRAAEGGTLFLDEIGDIPIDLQPKLLRFLESHEIHPLGEAHPTRLDVRVIAATNVDLPALIASGRFREDLFYRLNVVPLHLPPLRERREEIPALAAHFIRRFAAEERKGTLTLNDEALECLLLFRWPGNVRQLANEIHRIVAMADPDSVITAAHLAPAIRGPRRSVPAAPPLPAAAEPPEPGFRPEPGEPLPAAVERLERLMVAAALKRADGRMEDAARMLGISRKGLFLKRRRWGLGLNGMTPDPDES